jgi:hypothetical protein
MVFLAGQGDEAADGHLSPEFADQVQQALRNLPMALHAAQAVVPMPAPWTECTWPRPRYRVDHIPRRGRCSGHQARASHRGTHQSQLRLQHQVHRDGGH